MIVDFKATPPWTRHTCFGDKLRLETSSFSGGNNQVHANHPDVVIDVPQTNFANLPIQGTSLLIHQPIRRETRVKWSYHQEMTIAAISVAADMPPPKPTSKNNPPVQRQ